MKSNSNCLKLHLPNAPREKIHWGNLLGCSASLAIASAATQYHGIVVIIAPDALAAKNLHQELAFFYSGTIWYFPDWELLPYDIFSPHQDLISQRLSVLYQLLHNDQGVLILTAATITQRLAPATFVLTNSLQVAINDTVNLSQLQTNLQKSGYQRVSQVISHGEFAIRGAIIDLYPMGSHLPYRIEFFDNEVISIRRFDPEGQCSIEKVTTINLLPAREFPLDSKAIAYFHKQWCHQFSADPDQCPIYQNITKRNLMGAEYYLPLFFEKTQNLCDYLPKTSLIIHLGEVKKSLAKWQQHVDNRYQQLRHDITRPILPPAKLFLDENELFAKFKQFSQIFIHEQSLKEKAGHINFPINALPVLAANHRWLQPFKRLVEFINHHHHPILLCAQSDRRKQLLLSLLKKADIYPSVIDNWLAFIADVHQFCDKKIPMPPSSSVLQSNVNNRQVNQKNKGQHNSGIYLAVASLNQGITCSHPFFHIITESELLGQRLVLKHYHQTNDSNQANIIRNLTELNIGDPVVHLDHGVGRYLGLKTLTVDDHSDEYVIIAYACDNKLYVPISSLSLISRYIGADNEHVPLHKLGSEKWQQAKKRAISKAYDVAAELLAIYAKRAILKAHCFSYPEQEYLAFADSFPFEETPDQARAIEQVIKDLCSHKAMDRLICGDVGFGKTEVAMRAAFIVVQNSRQVAILVPTTLLAQQHYDNFKNRFANWPIETALLSRFCTKKQQQQTIKRLSQGKIDIIIGTQRLLQQDVSFSKLGLIVIDEEHRFGVRDKEKLKKRCEKVDVLTLTATPIPRTLNLSLANICDLSLIASAPTKRLAIKTLVTQYKKHLIYEAISREISRGGQVYFLHNNISTIKAAAKQLQQLIPNARIAIGHGQMPEKQLERIIYDFYRHCFDILVCSTIIESGIDIPTANTIIIDRADQLGLAQLHQLRGRVGRSHHQAYAYLLIPQDKKITSDAKKRLEAIAQLEDLGIGFTLATHDLEIRGTGELLGKEQKGHIEAIGFTLYHQLLERAISDLKTGKKPTKEIINNDLSLNLSCSTIIPSDYLPDPHTRLVFYKRLASAQSYDDITKLKIEMVDRFGMLPQVTENLFESATIKRKALALGIDHISLYKHHGILQFAKNTTISPQTIIQLLQTGNDYHIKDGNKLSFDLKDSPSHLEQLHALIDYLSTQSASDIEIGADERT